MKTLVRTSIVTALVAMLAVGSVAFAQTSTSTATTTATTTTTTATSTPGMWSKFARLFVHKNGKAQVAGTVQAVGSNSFIVATKGGTWTVNVTADTKFDHKLTLAHMSVGNVVMVHGDVVENMTNTVTAKKVQNKSAIKIKVEEKKKAKADKKAVRNLDTTGNVQTTATSSLTVKAKDGTTMTINTDANTRVYTKNWLVSSLSAISAGHTIKAFGTTTSSTTMNAVLIHNLSI